MSRRASGIDDGRRPPPVGAVASASVARGGGVPPLGPGIDRASRTAGAHVRSVGARDRINRGPLARGEGVAERVRGFRRDPDEQVTAAAGRLAADLDQLAVPLALAVDGHRRPRAPAQELERSQPGEGVPDAAAARAGDARQLLERHPAAPGRLRPAQVPPKRPLQRRQVDRSSRRLDRPAERVGVRH